ncbi:MAG: SRPBCC domain-containing protein [Polyangiaceae bacterium]
MEPQSLQNKVEHKKTTFKLSRVLDAPRALVWEALTRPEHLVHWWGPKGMSLEVHCYDPAPGGLFLYSMTMPSGETMWGKWVFREVSPITRLEFVASFSDAEAGITRHPMAPDWPRETLSTIELTEENGRTTVHLTGQPISATELEQRTFEGGIEGMNKGWEGTWSVLDEYLRLAKQGEGRVTDREMLITRVIDAPREKIFDAWADRERIAKWWGPKGFHSTIAKFDFRPGGEWKFVMHGPDGRDYQNDNSFVEIQRPSRIVLRHGSKPVFQLAVTFEDLGGGKTRVVWRATFSSQKALEAVRSFALPGAEENLDKLTADVLASLS